MRGAGAPLRPLALLVATLAISCSQGPAQPAPREKAAAPKAPEPKATEDAAARARRVHRDALVLDAHCDALMRAVDDGVDLTVRNAEGHVDLPKLRDGGVDAQVFALWADPDEWKGKFRARIDAMIAAYGAMIDKSAGGFVRATTAADASLAAREGKVAAFLGLEGGYAIEGDPGALERLYGQGVRYMTLTWWNNTGFADGSGDEPKWHGLNDAGRGIVHEMNRLGMLVDVSHASEETFYDVLATATAPVIASHSGARAVADHHRNLTDDQLRALAKNGGVVGIDFVAGFLDAENGRRGDELREILKPRFAAIDKANAKRPGRAREERWRLFNEEAKSRLPPVPLSKLVDHIEHAVRVAGPEHVGLGSDFDGFALGPVGIGSAADLPRLTEALLARGLSERDVAGILGGNFLRVFRQVLDAAPHSAPEDGGPVGR
jgi:membrane dipeptidase